MSKNGKSLESFMSYCYSHPEERFWQALTNWSGHPYIGWTREYGLKGFHDLWNQEDK